MTFRSHPGSHSGERPVSEQAAEWLATLSDEACTPDERRAFAAWLTRANTHVDEFLRIKSLTHRLEDRSAWPEVNMEQLIAAAKAQVNVTALTSRGAHEVSNPAAASPVRLGRIWASAATVMLLVLTGVIGYRYAVQRDAYSTGLGELRSIRLEDGSIVQLDAYSSLRIHFTSAARSLELVSGKAIFNVAPDSRRPFRVLAGVAEIVAVGTQFNVDAAPDRTTVTVIEGRVRLAHSIQGAGAFASGSAVDTKPAAETIDMLLSASEQAVIESRRPIHRVGRVDAAKVSGWTLRRLYFDETPLAEAAQEFARYSPAKILIEDSTLASRRISGAFDSSDPAALVQFLARYGDTNVTPVEQGWIVRRRD